MVLLDGGTTIATLKHERPLLRLLAYNERGLLKLRSLQLRADKYAEPHSSIEQFLHDCSHIEAR